jgi:hypothetical protein
MNMSVAAEMKMVSHYHMYLHRAGVWWVADMDERLRFRRSPRNDRQWQFCIMGVSSSGRCRYTTVGTYPTRKAAERAAGAWFLDNPVGVAVEMIQVDGHVLPLLRSMHEGDQLAEGALLDLLEDRAVRNTMKMHQARSQLRDLGIWPCLLPEGQRISFARL